MKDLLIKFISDILRSKNSNEEKHIIVILIGIVVAVILSLTLIGRNNVNMFFHQFSTDILASGAFSIALLILSCILAVLFIIAGLLELNIVKDEFSEYVPPPAQGAWIINIVVCVLITLQVYTSITNILQYCIVYLVFIFVDTYFRYSISGPGGKMLQKALKDLALNSVYTDSKDHEVDVKYQKLLELYIHYKRYPLFSIAFVRLLLTLSAVILIIFGKYGNNVELNNIAYINMIYCFIVNETFSWGYRIKMFTVLKSDHYK